MRLSEKMIEFDKIKEIWKSFTLTQKAGEMIEEAGPLFSEAKLAAKLRETTESRILLNKGGNPPLVSLQGISDMVHGAGKGDCLSAEQLEEIEKALVAVSRLKEYLNNGKQYGLSLVYYEENLDSLEELRNQIRQQIRNKRVDDSASRLLKSLRADLERLETKMKEKADTVIRTNKEYMSDNYSTYRNGHLCIPVKKDYKFKIPGSILDQSSTGSTFFIEPISVGKYYEELQLLKLSEENEIRRILYTLTGMVADSAEIFYENIRMIEKLDFIFSKGRLSQELNAVEPVILTERRIRLVDARHPLMEEKLCIPLQFDIGGDTRGIVITGPNTGGKTIAIKTVALNCMMAQCGLHVTCREAEICMNTNYLCDIGDGQNLSENLSTFSAHITNVLEILADIHPQSLVIMDELGSGTDPMEGMGIAVAILEELRTSGALFLVTTHYPEVKQYALEKEGICNARMTFDRDTLKPLYQMVIGEAGESCAFYIANRLGMPEPMLRLAAKYAYGEELAAEYQFRSGKKEVSKRSVPRIVKQKVQSRQEHLSEKFQLGDSVMVLPDQKIGIVCRPVNEKGVLQVQLPNKKIWISHKRVRLQVAASQLYPEDYDFSIIFDSVETRKLRHQMERKFIEGAELHLGDGNI